MKNHFFFSYAGNKRNEVEKIVASINLNDIKTIIEPFCGTCAFSYYVSTLYPKKFNYILNDNNEYLIKLMKIFKNKKKSDNFIKKINALCFDKNNNFIDKPTYIKIIKEDNIYSYFIMNKYYSIRNGLYPVNKSKINPINNTTPFINFLRNENIIFKNEDAINVIKTNIDDNETLLFIDPPYIFTNNNFYKNPTFNIYEYIFSISEQLLLKKSTLLFCLENIWIIQLLFKNLKDNFFIYDKVYQTSKKKTEHILINNKKNNIL